jgi:hypothetical protein
MAEYELRTGGVMPSRGDTQHNMPSIFGHSGGNVLMSRRDPAGNFFNAIAAAVGARQSHKL